MATVSLRSGARRLLPLGAKAVIHGEAGTPAILAIALTTRRSSSLSYHPQVDPMSPLIHLPGVAFLELQVETALVSGSDDPLTFAAISSPPHGSQVGTRSLLTPGLNASSSGGLTTFFRRVPSACPSHPQMNTRNPLTAGLLGSVSGGYFRRVASPYHSHLQTYAGSATSSRRPYASMASPRVSSRPMLAGFTGNNYSQVRKFSGDADGNATPETCKCDAVLKGLEKIETKIGEVSSKVDAIDGKIDKNIADGGKVKVEVVELLKSKEKGSGDWTSFKMKGKTINWLSVGSAIWAIFK